MARPCPDAATSRLNFVEPLQSSRVYVRGRGVERGEMSRAVANVHDDLLQ